MDRKSSTDKSWTIIRRLRWPSPEFETTIRLDLALSGNKLPARDLRNPAAMHTDICHNSARQFPYTTCGGITTRLAIDRWPSAVSRKEYQMRVSRFVLPLLLATSALAVAPTASFAQISIGVSVTIAPPVLPVYEQPPIPAPGYIWTPGYWAYGDDGYYWVPGTWVEPPSVGLLWTPGYWGWNDGAYVFNAGYWGPTVGFYGGINYGFGYGGFGYEGGYWDHGQFAYNRSVNNFGSTHITNVYNKTVINNYGESRASFNGGAGGVAARPTPEQVAYAHERHEPPTRAQIAHVEAARSDRSLLASENHGRPPIAATARPGELHGAGAVAAREAGPANAAAERERTQAAARPNEPARAGSAPRPEEHAAARPATTRPEEHAAARPAAPRPAEHAAARPAAPRPAEHAAARPAAPRPAEHAAARPAAPRPVEHAAARPATPRPVEHAAARPAAPRPVQHAAARPAAPRPVQHAAARPAAPRPVQHAAARPAAPRPVAHAAAPHAQRRPEG
jgi:hypothetical protein